MKFNHIKRDEIKTNRGKINSWHQSIDWMKIRKSTWEITKLILNFLGKAIIAIALATGTLLLILLSLVINDKSNKRRRSKNGTRMFN